MIEEIPLKQPLFNWINSPSDEQDFLNHLSSFKTDLKEFVDLVEKGETVFVKIVDLGEYGNYNSSIAKVSIKGEIFETDVGGYHTNGPRPVYVRGEKMRYFSPCLTWDKLKNKIHPHLMDLVWLKGYEGPTILKKFDTKKEKEKVLAKLVVLDMDGESLSAGDKVIYINARYGGGMRLCRGKIIRFDASVNAARAETFTIVADGDGVESKISDSMAFILLDERN